MKPDTINGLFEFAGAAASATNVRRLWCDRVISGVDWRATGFFTAWGLWNLFYYPSLGQWFSVVGGSAIVLVNAAWLALVWRFRRHG